VVGNVPPETEYPVPVIESELTVAATEPLEVTVTDFVTAVPTETLPNDSEVVLRLSAADAALSCSETALVLLPAVTVSVADCVLLTEATFAVKVVLDPAAGTVTEPGTVTAGLLAASARVIPPAGAEPDRLTVHVSDIEPVIAVLLQDTALTVGSAVAPVPLRLTVAVDALLETVNCPVVELAVAGSY